MEVHEALAKAWEEVEQSGVPEIVQQVAFREALARVDPVQHRPGVTPPPRASVRGNGDPKGERETPDPASSGTDLSANELFEKLALETGISVERWEPVIHFVDGKPGMSVPTRRLGSNKANQARAIALILTSARHFGLDEAETSVEVIREACVAAKCYDQGNFAKQVAATPGVNSIGPRNQKKLKTRGDTITKLTTIIDKINGTEDS